MHDVDSDIQDNIRVTGSMDACGLFPAIKRCMAIKAVIDSAKELKINYSETDPDVFIKMAALMCPREEIITHGLDDVVPVPKSTTTLNSYTHHPSNNQFQTTKQAPTPDQLNIIISLAISRSVNEAMLHHYYSIGGCIKRQADGGAIGVDLTNEVSCLYMLRWDREFREKMKRMGLTIILYKRYVDDITILMNRIMPGWDYNQDLDCMEYNEDRVEADKMIPDDERTMRILCKVANSISELRFTMDCPSLNGTKMVPILDTQFWIE